MIPRGPFAERAGLNADYWKYIAALLLERLGGTVTLTRQESEQLNKHPSVVKLSVVKDNITLSLIRTATPERCEAKKCGEYNPLRCVRSKGHDGEHNYAVDGQDGTTLRFDGCADLRSCVAAIRAIPGGDTMSDPARELLRRVQAYWRTEPIDQDALADDIDTFLAAPPVEERQFKLTPQGELRSLAAKFRAGVEFGKEDCEYAATLLCFVAGQIGEQPSTPPREPCRACGRHKFIHMCEWCGTCHFEAA